MFVVTKSAAVESSAWLRMIEDSGFNSYSSLDQSAESVISTSALVGKHSKATTPPPEFGQTIEFVNVLSSTVYPPHLSYVSLVISYPDVLVAYRLRIKTATVLR